MVDASPVNVWRYLFGPEGTTAPFSVRNQMDFYDVRLQAGACLDFLAIEGKALYFYVFNGTIRVSGKLFREADQGLLREGGHLSLEATSSGITVAFLVDCNAQITRSGTVGDNRRIPPAIAFRALRLWSKLRHGWLRPATTAS
jgi:redox-sensitive bicupin YhaK (pirin superfamily)